MKPYQEEGIFLEDSITRIVAEMKEGADNEASAEDYATRLVACYNECSDLSTKALQQGLVHDLMGFVYEYSQWARVQGYQRTAAHKMGYFLGLAEDIAGKNERGRS